MGEFFGECSSTKFSQEVTAAELPDVIGEQVPKETLSFSNGKKLSGTSMVFCLACEGSFFSD